MKEFLLHGHAHEEPLVFAPEGAEAVAEAIDLTFRNAEDPTASIEALIDLAAVLEFEEQSPTAAGVILDALVRHPQAAAVVERLQRLAQEETEATKDGDAPDDWVRARESVPGGAKKLAPRVGEAPPPGSVRLSTTINPGGGRGRPPLTVPARPAERGRRPRRGRALKEE